MEVVSLTTYSSENATIDDVRWHSRLEVLWICLIARGHRGEIRVLVER
jgi:hypothetical protein